MEWTCRRRTEYGDLWQERLDKVALRSGNFQLIRWKGRFISYQLSVISLLKKDSVSLIKTKGLLSFLIIIFFVWVKPIFSFCFIELLMLCTKAIVFLLRQPIQPAYTLPSYSPYLTTLEPRNKNPWIKYSENQSSIYLVPWDALICGSSE